MTGNANIAVIIKSNMYNRANNIMICFIPAPFTLRIATSFCLRSVSRVIAAYTPSKVIIKLTTEKNKIISLSLVSNACSSLMSSRKVDTSGSILSGSTSRKI